MPNLESNIWQVYKDLGCQVLGIGAYESNASQVKQWGDKHGVTFPLLLDPDGSIFNMYSNGAVPYNVVIDTLMFLRYSEAGYDEAAIIEVIEQYLPTTVPVELASFTATSGDNWVELNWTTASETNNLGFKVERSYDQFDFDKVGFVIGHQTTTIPQNYSFTDKNIYPATYYYRLKQIDNNGSFEYSNVIAVEVKAPASFGLEQNYPNPFNSETKIRFKLTASSHVKLQIFNTLGREIKTLVRSKLNAGVHSIRWDGKDNNGKPVPSGIYFYQLKAGKFSQVKKMNLLR